MVSIDLPSLPSFYFLQRKTGRKKENSHEYATSFTAASLFLTFSYLSARYEIGSSSLTAKSLRKK
jgi:hypothetical protein